MLKYRETDAAIDAAVEEMLSMYNPSKPKNSARILTREEVSSLNRDGAHLQPDKFYITSFLINASPNNAADPYPFQIMPEALEKFAKSAVGRPFVLGANSSSHVRGPKGHFSTPEEIIQFQKQFAAGEIVHQYINRQTGNANVIIEIFPEYSADVRAGKIPPYVSPLIENSSANLQMKDGRLLVRDGRILHLQAVDKPGYGEVATIHGTCEGMLDNCMNQLRALGAAGKLKLSQFELNLYNSYKDIGLKDDIATIERISGDGPTQMNQYWAAIIADFEVRTKKLASDKRAARIEQLLKTGEDLKPLAKLLQGYSLKLKEGDITVGASASEDSDTAILHGEEEEVTDSFEIYESIRESSNQSGIVPRKKQRR